MNSRAIIALILFLALLPVADAQYSTTTSPSKPFYSLSTWTAEAPVKGTATVGGTGGQITAVDVFIKSSKGYWNGVNWQPTEFRLKADIPAPGSNVNFNYTFKPPDNGSYDFSSQATRGNELLPREKSKTIVYDNAKPKPTLSTLPAWSTTKAISLIFGGTDLPPESGIKKFRIFYDARRIQQPMTSPSFILDREFLGPGTYQFSSIPKNNYTYTFYVEAEDMAGNVNSTKARPVSTSIDTLKPICTMEPLPAFMKLVEINWSILENISGIQISDVQILIASEWKDANIYCPYPKTNKKADKATCTNLFFGDNAYSFRCNSTDIAENEGVDSPIVTTTRDTQKPTSLMDDFSPFTNSFRFPVSWSGDDGAGSGIDCYYVQWRDGATWSNITNSTPGTCLRSTILPTFGDGKNNTIFIIPNDKSFSGNQYFFQVQASDKVGNRFFSWSAQKSITLDYISPNIFIEAFDQNSNRISGGTQGTDVTKITATSKAQDNGKNPSGLQNHTVYIEITQETISLYSRDCFDKEDCSLIRDGVGNADQIRFWSETRDKAGNTNQTEKFIISPHPLTNFVTHDITFSTGTSFQAEVQVRNMNMTNPINLSIKVSDYQPAGFIAGSGDFESFKVTDMGRGVDILELKSGGSGLFHVELVAADPRDYTNQLNVTAYSSTGIYDEDIMKIQLSFPAGFSGLNDLALALLTILAIAAYVLMRPGNQHK